MVMQEERVRNDRIFPAEVPLSKRVVAGAVVYFFNNPAFPDYIHIAFENCNVCSQGDVVNLLDVSEELGLIPLVRLDELVLNIPSREMFDNFFREQYNVGPGESMSWEMQRNFWDLFEWEFATKVGKTKIEWIDN